MRKLLTLLSVMAGFYSFSQSICGGKCTTLTAGNPQNLSNPQYSMQPGSAFPISGTNQFQICPPSTSTYTLYTTGNNTANVVVTTSAVVTVTVNPQPVITPTLIQPSCTSTVVGLNLGLTFLPSSPAPTYTITWYSTPNGVLSPQQYSVASGVAPGTYAFTITAQGGCQVIDSVKLNPPPAPATFSLFPFSPTMSLTCITNSFDIAANNPGLTYTWSSTSQLPVSSESLNISSPGCWTVVGQNPGSFCTKTVTFCVVVNTVAPQSTVTPLSQIITCTNTAAQTVSVFSNPTVNIAHYIYDPPGGTFIANSHTLIYQVPGIGIYTHVIVNLENGCQTQKTFTITSTQGYPTFSLQSPQSFTLGCSTKSVATINFVNASASTPGAGVTYTIIGPPTSTAVVGGTLSPLSTYTFFSPGSYTAIVRELPSNCETKSLFSLLTNTQAPNLVIDSPNPIPVLDCDHTVTVLQGASFTDNVSYQWSFIGTPNSVATSSVKVVIDPAKPTNTVINSYTLTITDNSSLCKSTFTTVVNQNLFPPKPLFSLGTASITCITPTIVITNISTSGIPAGVYPVTQPVVGYLWQGPSPQDPLSNSTTYTAYIPGPFTLTAKDMNNGCLATYTANVIDYRDYPVFTPSSTPVNCGSVGTASTGIVTNLQNGGAEYLWTPLITPLPNTSDRKKAFIVTDKSGKYQIAVTNTVNGCVTTKTVVVSNSTLTADFAVDKVKGYAPLTVNFVNNSSSIGLDASGNSIATSTGITSVWSLGNGKDSTVLLTNTQIKRTYTQPGTYSIALHVIKGSCIDDSVQYITVEIPSRMKVPNIFTPNNDKINDYWFLETANLSEITCSITDRWGHLVYELNSKTGNILWDGKNQAGVEVAEGVYFFIVKGKGLDGTDFEEKGTVTLVR